MRCSRWMQRIMTGTTCWVLILAMLFPLCWLVITATRKQREAFSLPPRLFCMPTLENFEEVLGRSSFLPACLNTLIIAAVTVTLGLAFGVPCGYALARSKSRLGRAMGVWILMARMVPAIGFVIPFYSLFRRLGLNDSYFTISLIYLTIVLPFTAWLMMGFIKGIPEQIEEAAMMDGCSRAQTLVRVIVPVCGPGIATSAIFAFMLSWNEFFYAMIMTGRNTKVVSVVIQGFITTTGTEWGRLCAAATLIVFPIILFTAFAQKALVRGLTSGAVKG